ncbi:MAG: 3-hydroxyacyl-CoA dehydrogenase NAD-binding domain-containing protein [Pseudomonadota bacterium]
MTDVIGYDRVGDIAVLTADNPPVNALSQAVRQGLMDGMDRAEADKGVRAVVIVGAGRAFFAGADIKEFGKAPLEPSLPDVIDRIEASPLIVIASMHGVSLGGGLEVALGCHYRIAVPSARLGLPEVHLGLIPGAGGTQRLPRLTGVEPALGVMTTGRHVKAPEALEMGVLDDVQDGDPRSLGLAYAEKLLAEGGARRPVSEMPLPDPIDWDAAFAATLARGKGQISPAWCVRAVEAAFQGEFQTGLKGERKIFSDLMKTDQRQGMIHAFFGERAVGNLPELKGVAPREVAHIAVIGGGTMGAGIATSALLSGLRVHLLEMSAEAGIAARERIESNLAGALKRGKITAEAHGVMLSDALHIFTDYAALAEVDLVIEAVFEDMDVKKRVFAQLDAVCKPGCVLASNTSYLDINEIAATTSRPADVLGLHFFSPAHVMKLLEVVVGDATAPDVAATGFALGKRLGKISVRAGVCDGFIGNRILSTYRTCADDMILDGASPYAIDAALEEFGFAMGPFAVADLAGLDIGWAVRKRKRAEGAMPARDATYADTLCEAGHFGQKTGKGYYDYAGGPKARVPNPDVLPLIDADRARLGITPRDFTAQEIVRRYMAAMVNEAAKVVGEGIARRPVDVDMVLHFGYGFPRYRGGPLKWADMTGLAELLDDINGYAAGNPDFWSPAPLLQELVAQGRTFDDLNKKG